MAPYLGFAAPGLPLPVDAALAEDLQNSKLTVPAGAAVRKLTQGASAVPDYVDWGERGKLTPPKDLAPCGATWAFAAATALEAKLAIDHGKLLNLSTQQLVDCVDAAHGYPHNDGCYSGFAEDAFSYIQAHGLATEAAYGKYAAQKLACKESLIRSLPASQLVRLSASPGYKNITPNSATALMQAVSEQPVVVYLWISAAVVGSEGIKTGPCPSALADSRAEQAKYEMQ
ncbi:hypothetical protein N2152v2_010109 [Parachlorella kessleri]